MMHEPPFLNSAGARDGDFVVKKYTPIPELNCVLREIVHLPTGALVMHIANDDPENLFCLSFQTLPTSSKGAPHILEHIVLCGSDRFPLKDPFFSMQRRSLNTFMNALTGADFTCYPASSLVEKDFYNLLEVYLDAVFHPQLKELSFLQEGHRLEFTDPTDPASPLQYKGVVFNEMKGAMNSAESRLWHLILESLFPNLPYAFNSGGDPAEIPELTLEELKEFHRTHYHPSRCLFFFYGNLPLKQHLNAIAPSLAVPSLPPLPLIPPQPRLKEPLHKVAYYPIDPAEKTERRAFVAFGWLTARLIDQEDVLALSLLDIILMESDASLLKKVLLTSKLCIQADAHLEIEFSEVPYLIVCKGCDGADAKAIEDLIFDTLRKIADKPVPKALIEAALHQLELARLEITGDHAPFGLTLFMRAALAKQHGCDPETALCLHALFDRLATHLKNPDYLSNLIRRYFIDNPHRIRLDMYPDAELLAQETASEIRSLKKIESTLSQEQKKHLIKQAKALASYQESIESLDCLPAVSLADISPTAKEFPLASLQHQQCDVFYHDVFTNHFVYADLIFDLPDVRAEDLPYVRLMTHLLTEIGCGKRDYLANLEYVQMHTGGLHTTCALHPRTDDPKKAAPCIHLRGKALYRKADRLLPLMKETLLTPRLTEQERICELLLQHRDSLRNRVSKQGMRYAVQLALSGLTMSGFVGEAWSGIHYYRMIETLCDEIQSNPKALIDRLIQFHQQWFCLHQPVLVLAAEKTWIEQLHHADFHGITDLPTPASFSPWKGNFELQKISSQARPIASPVAFCAEAFHTASYLHPMAPALLVATQLFDHKILHPSIREQGGAYGSGATYNANTGHFYFHSYRDPHIAATWQTFHRAIDSMAAGKFSSKDLEEAKLGIIQQLDAPVAPGSRALSAYSRLRDHRTHEMRQAFRTRLLELNSKDVQRAVEMLLLPQKEAGVFVAFAGQALIEKENCLSMPGLPKGLPIFSIL